MTETGRPKVDRSADRRPLVLGGTVLPPMMGRLSGREAALIAVIVGLIGVAFIAALIWTFVVYR